MLYIHLKSLLSFGFYRRLIFATRRQMVLYAFYLFFLSCVVAYFAAGSYVNRTVPLLLKNFPQVTFEKGVLTAPEQAVSAQIPNTDFKITFDASAQQPPSREDFVRTNTLFWVNKSTVYIPSSSGVQTQPVPSDFSFVTSQENLAKEKNFLMGTARVMLFFFSVLAVPAVMFFSFCLAASVGLVFKMLRRSIVPRKVVFKWAFFLLGPLAVLWYVRLWVPIPLFPLAQTILCIIYMQQIFNLTEVHR